jgi:proteasome lid subunit RPN8/RPN11
VQHVEQGERAEEIERADAVGRSAPRLSDEILRDLYAHARETFPKECCGWIRAATPAPAGASDQAPGASDPHALEVIRCTNRQDQLHAMDPAAHPRTAETAYAIEGRELLTLTRSFDGDRPALVIYHSHPRVGAYFSAEDVRAALAAGHMVDYLVMDCQEDQVAGAVLFRRTAGGDTFEAIASYPSEQALRAAPAAPC